jgi:S-DNA-T family DNA segregation ATPase FtsK/SpoIIIE
MSTQARRTNRRFNPPEKKLIGHGLREIVLIFFCFIGLYLFVSLLTYYGGDPGWSHSGPVDEIKNKGGVAGALFADLFFYLFGYFAYLFPIMVGYIGWLIYQGRHHAILAEPKSLIVPGIGFVLTLTAGCGLAIVHFMVESALLPTHAGGILGMWTGNGLVSIVDRLGATLILLAIFFTGITLLTGLSWLKLMDILGYHTLRWLPVVENFITKQFFPRFREHAGKGLHFGKNFFSLTFQKSRQWSSKAYEGWQIRRTQWREERKQYWQEDDEYDDDDDYFIEDEPLLDESSQKKTSSQTHISQPVEITTPLNVESNVESVEPVQPAKKIAYKKNYYSENQSSSQLKIKEEPEEFAVSEPEVNFTSQPPLLPSLDLLAPVPSNNSPLSEKMLAQRIVDAFASLQIEVVVKMIEPGPVLIRVEIQSNTQINTNHLKELSEALVQTLRVKPIKIKETQLNIFSIEMPNLKRQTIYLSELLQITEYQSSSSSLAVALGQDIGGQPVIVELNRIPHILMAGSQAIEKNQAIHALIISLIYKSTPSRLRFILIDDVTQEFSVYSQLPHLLVPVVKEMEEATLTLCWCVQEMESRYRQMVEFRVRNIEDYNQVLQQQRQAREDDASLPAPLYYIVVIINEIEAFMKSIKAPQVEEATIRLTQKARAAGIHIILATQHPSVNVITGLIKANISTRMAFQVTNKGESRIILGQPGAEELLGEGDMLYMTAGTGMPARIHGSYISPAEIENIVTDLKSRATPDYIELKLGQ